MKKALWKLVLLCGVMWAPCISIEMCAQTASNVTTDANSTMTSALNPTTGKIQLSLVRLSTLSAVSNVTWYRTPYWIENIESDKVKIGTGQTINMDTTGLWGEIENIFARFTDATGHNMQTQLGILPINTGLIEPQYSNAISYFGDYFPYTSSVLDQKVEDPFEMMNTWTIGTSPIQAQMFVEANTFKSINWHLLNGNVDISIPLWDKSGAFDATTGPVVYRSVWCGLVLAGGTHTVHTGDKLSVSGILNNGRPATSRSITFRCDDPTQAVDIIQAKAWDSLQNTYYDGVINTKNATVTFYSVPQTRWAHLKIDNASFKISPGTHYYGGGINYAEDNLNYDGYLIDKRTVHIGSLPTNCVDRWWSYRVLSSPPPPSSRVIPTAPTLPTPQRVSFDSLMSIETTFFVTSSNTTETALLVSVKDVKNPFTLTVTGGKNKSHLYKVIPMPVSTITDYPVSIGDLPQGEYQIHLEVDGQILCSKSF